MLRVLLKSNLDRGILSSRRAVAHSLQVRFDILKVEMVLCVFGIEIPSGEHVSMMGITISSSANWTEKYTFPCCSKGSDLSAKQPRTVGSRHRTESTEYSSP